MLTCKEFLNSLNEYFDDNAAAEIRALVESHINTCPNCWVILDTTRKTLQIYKGMEPQPLPPGLHDRIMSALDKRK
ncbi:MAG: zf-HC2 domain-containing protein [Acidimicrobiia bacterium]|nr:zf-HC2 domain-containing protein [Acidimicrobiia bacterium]